MVTGHLWVLSDWGKGNDVLPPAVEEQGWGKGREGSSDQDSSKSFRRRRTWAEALAMSKIQKREKEGEGHEQREGEILSGHWDDHTDSSRELG